jgi:polyisoprenoid-binding protein YceI
VHRSRRACRIVVSTLAVALFLIVAPSSARAYPWMIRHEYTASTVASADAALSRIGTPSVSFTATGPAGLKIVGTTADLQVAEENGTVTVRVPLANLDTGIGLRNKHMKEKYLEVPLYPNAELAVPRASLAAPDASGSASGEATGTMTIHGKSRPVRFTYRVARAGDRSRIAGSVHVEMTDFGIAVPGYLGVTVKPGVDVAVTFDTAG